MDTPKPRPTPMMPLPTPIYEDWATLAAQVAASQPSALICITDEHTAKLCLPLVRPHLPPIQHTIVIPAGEIHKNLHTCQQIWQELLHAQADRKALIILIGGGVVGDMGGFCAATFKRGIAYLQVPTTLVAQIDAAIGAKVAIDFQEIKNTIGLFVPPVGIFIATMFLETLPERELKSGYAELLKHALIADEQLYHELIKTDFSNLQWSNIVPRAAAIKVNIVNQDPLEQGLRKVLNVGHSIGHALESYFLFTQHPLTHGEAVALGIIAESYISMQQGHLPSQDFAELKRHLEQVYAYLPIFVLTDWRRFWGYLLQDKKNRQGSVQAVVITTIGQAHTSITLHEHSVKNALTQVKWIHYDGI